jgi:hypothetical protein
VSPAKSPEKNSPSRKSSPDKNKVFWENDGVINLAEKDSKVNLALITAKPNLTEKDIALAFQEITKESTAKLIGLVSHLSYWSVFGHLNPLPLDKYHMKQIFISIAQIQQTLESRFGGKKVFATFIMPMIVLAIRIEVEMIFKTTYKVFFSKP